MSLENENLPLVIRDKSYENDLKRIATTYPNIHKLDFSFDWLLQRNCTIGRDIGDGYYLWVNDELYNITYPEIVILYHYDLAKNTVTLINMELGMDIT